jgi:NAD(P)H-nitrite reductase large subunit
MLRAMQRKHVPIRYETDLVRVDAYEGSLRAVFRGRKGRETSVDVDAVCMNAGFEPQNEILRLLGATMRYDPAFGHLRCQRDDMMATSVEHVYAVGDCAGLGGAPAAIVEGRIAGVAAAAACGFGKANDLHADLRELRRHRRFQHHLWKLYRVAPQSLEVADDTIVCRCEQVTLGALKASVSDAPGHVGTVKRATRLGMGRCQGRYCGPAAIRFLAETTARPVEDVSHFAPRIPVKPVAISAIVAAQEALNGQD